MSSIIYLAHKYRRPDTECKRCGRPFANDELYYTAHFCVEFSSLFSLCIDCYKDETSSDKEEQP